MRKQLFIGLAVEGTTDMRFLRSVVRRSYQKIVYDECGQEIDVDVFDININKAGKSFPEFVATASKCGVERYGILVLAVHADSDKKTLHERLEDKFIPAQTFIDSLNSNDYCNVITPVIPIRMIESWMMADTDLLKEEIGTSARDVDLGFHRQPETIADPKSTIEKAIRIVHDSLPPKRRSLTISDLYGIIGDKVTIDSLARLSSYCAFQEAIRESLRKIHYLA